MAIKLGMVRQETTEASCSQNLILVGGQVSQEDEAIDFLVFKDVANGKKYRLKVKNGKVVAEAITG